MKIARKSRDGGFTLFELMISMSVFLIISSAVFSGMITLQQNRRRTETHSSLEDRVRAASALLIRDIGQAGKMPSLDTALVNSSQAISGSSITVASTSAFYQGELISVDAGANQVTPPSVITALSSTSITTSAALGNHTSGTGIYPVGILAEGILSPNRSGSIKSSPSQLFLMGSIDTDTALQLVLYQCPANNAFGAFTRTVWTISHGVTSTTPTSTTTLFDQVSCSFTYSNDTAVTAADGTSLKSVNWVSFTISANTDTNEPGTNAPWNLNKSYMYIQPRNLTAVLNLPQPQVQDSPGADTVLGASSLP